MRNINLVFVPVGAYTTRLCVDVLDKFKRGGSAYAYCSMPAVHLTPAQTIKVHGLFPRSSLLTWNDVTMKALTFRYLLETLKIPVQKIHSMQPDTEAWVQAGLVGLPECKVMRLWPLNPLKHLGLSTDKLIGFSADELVQFGVSFAAMVECGLHPTLMQLFHFSLSEWTRLGMTVEFVARMKDAHCLLLFGTTSKLCIDDMNHLRPK